MLKFLGRACVGVYGVLKVALIVATLSLSAFVLTKAAIIEMNYFAKYEISHELMEREHQRCLVVGELIHSQMTWEKTADGLRQAYLDERTNRVQIQRQLKIREYEFYAFLKVLEKKYPGAAEEVLRELAPGVPLQPKPKLKLQPQPRLDQEV